MKYTDPSGRVWRPYSIEFTSPDSSIDGAVEGHFSFMIWAISREHAQLQLEAIRETATVGNELIERIE